MDRFGIKKREEEEGEEEEAETHADTPLHINVFPIWHKFALDINNPVTARANVHIFLVPHLVWQGATTVSTRERKRETNQRNEKKRGRQGKKMEAKEGWKGTKRGKHGWIKYLMSEAIRSAGEDGEVRQKTNREEWELIRDACWGNVIVLVDLRRYLNGDSGEKRAVWEKESGRQRGADGWMDGWTDVGRRPREGTHKEKYSEWGAFFFFSFFLPRSRLDCIQFILWFFVFFPFKCFSPQLW